MSRTLIPALALVLGVTVSACGPTATPEARVVVATPTAEPRLAPTVGGAPIGAMALLVRFQEIDPPPGFTYDEPVNYLPEGAHDMPAVQDQADMRFLDEQGEPAGGISVLVHDASAADAVWEWVRADLDNPSENDMPGGGREMMNEGCTEPSQVRSFCLLVTVWQVNGVTVQVLLVSLSRIDGPAVTRYLGRLATLTQVYFGD
jgi:hypothetical protein